MLAFVRQELVVPIRTGCTYFACTMYLFNVHSGLVIIQREDEGYSFGLGGPFTSQ